MRGFSLNLVHLNIPSQYSHLCLEMYFTGFDFSDDMASVVSSCFFFGGGIIS
jgi:hypothetical protein